MSFDNKEYKEGLIAEKQIEEAERMAENRKERLIAKIEKEEIERKAENNRAKEALLKNIERQPGE